MLPLPVRNAVGQWRSYFAAIVLVAAAVAAAVVFRRLPHANLSLLFLLVVLIVAARWGLRPAIFAGVLGFLALNLFFTEPFYTLSVEAEGDVATLVFFLVMAALMAYLAARMRTEMAGNRAALERVSALLDFSERMAAAPNGQQALQALVDRLARIFCAPAIALLPDDVGGLTPRAENLSRRGPDFHPHEAERAWHAPGDAQVFDSGWTYLQLTTAGGPIGVVGLGAGDIRRAQRRLGAALCEQASIAIERTRLVDDLRESQVVYEAERLRSGLLSSISHDLRTPLASIIGSATSVLEYGDVMNPEDRHELMQTIRDESQRLDRYIQNLLEMTRFGHPGFALRREWVDVNDLVAGAAERLGTALDPFAVRAAIAVDTSLIFVQGALIEQLLVNLLGNAADFSPPGGCITVAARAENEATVLEVVDEGPGIPEGDRDKVFDLFYRAQCGDRSRQGVGLGLAICRSIVAAHGGTIEATSDVDGGTRMRVVLPHAQEPTAETSDTDD